MFRDQGNLLIPVDGSEIQQTSWYGKYLIIYRVLYIPGGDRRISEPWTVIHQTETNLLTRSIKFHEKHGLQSTAWDDIHPSNWYVKCFQT